MMGSRSEIVNNCLNYQISYILKIFIFHFHFIFHFFFTNESRRLLENQLRPSELDLLHYEFVFDAKPIRDRFVQSMHFFLPPINNYKSIHNLARQLNERERFAQTALYKSLILEANPHAKFLPGLRY